MDHIGPRRGQRAIHPLWWTAITVVVIAAFVALCTAAFAGSFRDFVHVTLTADRSGLVMESGAKVKMRGVAVGRVAAVHGGKQPVTLSLELYPTQAQFIPANVEARIRATTAFGAKYVDLVIPENPSREHVRDGAVLRARNVSSEVNTVFQNILAVLDRIDPPKLNAVLTALADGVRGLGPRIGAATTAAGEVLTAVNERADAVRADWNALQGFATTYGDAAPDIVRMLRAVTTTGATVGDRAEQLDALLLHTSGLAHTGAALLADSGADLVRAINTAAPITELLRTYDPTYTCLLQGSTWVLDNGARANLGGNGRSVILDATLLFGDDPYRYPQNLPVVAARGGPGGRPSCGSLPDASQNFPVRQLITNTGWGTGLDVRPNPGIGNPCWANYFPVTRAVPEPASIRQCLPGPAIGPVPYPGAPAYGAPLYGPGGTPLWPGIPPAPPGP